VRGREKEGTGSVKTRWAAGWIQGWAEKFPRGSVLIFYFFFLLFFFWNSVLSLKEFFYSDLSKIKAVHFWIFKSVF
jgi:hypothetical protein